MPIRRKGFRGRGRKKREINERKIKKELRRHAHLLPKISHGQGCGMRGAGKNVESGVGFPSARRAEGTGGKSYPLAVRLEGATEG